MTVKFSGASVVSIYIHEMDPRGIFAAVWHSGRRAHVHSRIWRIRAAGCGIIKVRYAGDVEEGA